MDTGRGQILAVGRLSRDRVVSPAGTTDAEFSLLVGDPWHGKGLGREILARLIDVGRREGFCHLYAHVLLVNLRMQRLCSRLGFTLGSAGSSSVLRADLRL